MVRQVAGLLLYHGLLLAIGFAVLRLAGLLGRRRTTWLLGVAAAHLAGLAVLGLAVSLALTAGLTLRAPAVVGLAGVLLAILVGVGLRRRATPVPMLALPSRLHLIVPALVIALLLGEALASGSVGTAWDAAHMWTAKAVTIFHDGDIGAPLFRDAQNFGNSRLDYPLMQPVMASLAFRFAGNASQGLMTAELWLMAAAFVLAVPFVLRTLRVEATLPIAVAVVAAPVTGVLRGDADVAFAVFLAVGVLCLGEWLRGRHPGTLALGALLLGAGANVKNEGLVFGTLALLVALPFAARHGRRALLGLAAAGAAFAVLAAPWHLWVGAHGPFPGDQASIGQMLDWDFLRPRVHQLDYAARGLLGQLSDQSDKGWIVPGLAALGIAGLVRRPLDALAAWCLASVVAMCVALVWVYWSSPGDGVALVNVNIDRTVTGPLYVAAAAVALLLVRRPEPA